MTETVKTVVVPRASLMETMHHVSMISSRAAELAAQNERLTVERDDLSARNADLEKQLAELKPARAKKPVVTTDDVSAGSVVAS